METVHVCILYDTTFQSIDFVTMEEQHAKNVVKGLGYVEVASETGEVRYINPTRPTEYYLIEEHKLYS